MNDPSESRMTFEQAHQVFQPLWDEAYAIWEQFEKEFGFEDYVPADYSEVLRSLQSLQGKATTFLEWGSGLGVVTIMAGRLGFEAYGLEVAPQLIEHARRLSDRWASTTTFGQGSFVPNEYRWHPSTGEDGTRTDFDAPDGYESLDMRLKDFDIVYAYPWPDEHAVFTDILRRHGRHGTYWLTFDVREGMHRRKIRRLDDGH